MNADQMAIAISQQKHVIAMRDHEIDQLKQRLNRVGTRMKALAEENATMKRELDGAAR